MIEILPARPEHLPAILELWCEFMDFHAERDPGFRRSPDGHERFGEHVRSLLDSERDQVLVAREEGEIVGYSIAQLQERPPVFQERAYGFISDVAVRGDRRRRGVGERLYREILAWFRQRGVPRMELRAVTSNEVSCSFWRKMGFRTTVYCMEREME